ncbi:MAG: response regulator transcription factor [Flavobacteriales bacterium]|nr:response regulator transcription factor [Flavobacteriales bacterium]
MKEKKHILLVEDEENFGTVLKNYLELNAYAVTHCVNGKLALNSFRQHPFDLCIFDVMMPEMDGFTLAREIRKFDVQTPILFLTAKTQKHDMIEGYQIGADDYMTKPFDTEVLLLKLKAILNRKTQPEPDLKSFRIGNYQFDVNTRVLTLDDEQQKLSPKEAKLLELLCQNSNEVVTREVALNKIWGDHNYFTTRSMDVFITKLRKHLRKDPMIEIINVHGNGFRLLVK